jgi:hypothetical protein
MKAYANHKGNSGVTAYNIGTSYIDVRFVDGSIYRYTYASTGRENVEYMKQLAKEGQGLSTFISTTVRNDYAAKLQ